MMGAGERALLAETVRAVVADAAANADAALAAMGWLEMLASEPRDAIEIVFHELGAANATATALDDVLVAALGMTPRADLAALMPRYGGWDAPGRLEGDDAHAHGFATARVLTAREVLVVCANGPDVRAITVPAASAEMRAVHGIDPELGLQAVRIEHVAATGPALAADAWEVAVSFGRRAIAHQIAGASRTMLELARSHARERVQFDRPIASFQAVRHRLAEALVAVEALDATLQAAADEPNDLTATLAKATAGRTAREVAAHCQQVLAGIGFTTDHAFHRFLKRTMALEGLLGSADDLARDIGRRLLAARRVPTLIEL